MTTIRRVRPPLHPRYSFRRPPPPRFDPPSYATPSPACRAGGDALTARYVTRAVSADRRRRTDYSCATGVTPAFIRSVSRRRCPSPPLGTGSVGIVSRAAAESQAVNVAHWVPVVRCSQQLAGHSTFVAIVLSMPLPRHALHPVAHADCRARPRAPTQSRIRIVDGHCRSLAGRRAVYHVSLA